MWWFAYFCEGSWRVEMGWTVFQLLEDWAEPRSLRMPWPISAATHWGGYNLSWLVLLRKGLELLSTFHVSCEIIPPFKFFFLYNVA